MIESPQNHFLKLHDRLAALHPDAIAEAKALAAATVDPRTATTDDIWRIIWDKPLFANARVNVAKRWVANIEQDMQGASLMALAHRSGAVTVEFNLEPSSAARSADHMILGPATLTVPEWLSKGVLQVPPRRPK